MPLRQWAVAMPAQEMKIGAGKPAGMFIRAATDMLGSIGDETPKAATSDRAALEDADVHSMASSDDDDVDQQIFI